MGDLSQSVRTIAVRLKEDRGQRDVWVDQLSVAADEIDRLEAREMELSRRCDCLVAEIEILQKMRHAALRGRST